MDGVAHHRRSADRRGRVGKDLVAVILVGSLRDRARLDVCLDPARRRRLPARRRRTVAEDGVPVADILRRGRGCRGGGGVRCRVLGRRRWFDDRPQRAALHRAQHARRPRVVQGSVASLPEPAGRAAGRHALRLLVLLRHVARPAQPVVLRDFGDPVAVLVHGNLAPLAKKNFVGLLRVAAAAYRAQGILHRSRLDEVIHQLSVAADRFEPTLQVRRGQAALPKVLLPPFAAAPSLLVLFSLLHPFILRLSVRSLLRSRGFRVRKSFSGECPRDPESARERSLSLQQLADNLVIGREAEEVGGAVQLGHFLLHRVGLLPFFPSRAGGVGGDLSAAVLVSAVTLEGCRRCATDALLVYDADGAFRRATGTGFLLGF
mmetsp:Transcript_405/g.1896  ORF Transcript_405/g.1896 Transcript_405/m.1896 type:complete len:375 (-) Transcript_405:2154-3278(-)